MSTGQLKAEELVEGDLTVSVTFNDGHTLRFVPLDIFHPRYGLRNVQLWNLIEQVAQFDFARDRRNQLKVGEYSLAKGYTLAGLERYCLLARDFIMAKFKGQKIDPGFHFDYMAYCMYAISMMEYVASFNLVSSNKTVKKLRQIHGR